MILKRYILTSIVLLLAGITTAWAQEYVAQIGSQGYTSLAAAVAAVPTDGTATTVQLLADITLAENVVVGGTYGSTASQTLTITNQNVTLDLNGHTITGNKTLYLAGGSLNITGVGTIESASADVAPVGVRFVKYTEELDYISKRTLTIGENVTLEGAVYGLNIFGTNEGTIANQIEVNVNGTVKGMLFVLGNLKNAENDINIIVAGTVDASVITGSGEAVYSGIALNGNAKVTVANGATVKGDSGIEVRAGELIVNGGTITATSTEYSYTANNNGTTTKGAAIAVAQHSTNLPISITLNGGTLEGTKLIAVTDVRNNGLSDVTVITSNNFISGTVIPAGFIWANNGNGTSTLAPAPVRIGDVGYATLAEAIGAVTSDGVITLYDDISLTTDIECMLAFGSTFTLDFNNHIVYLNGNHVVLPTGVSVLTDVETSLFTAEGDNVVVKKTTGDTSYPNKYIVVKSIVSSDIIVTVSSAVYNGEGQTPTVVVKDGEYVLTAEDYVVSYSGTPFKNAKVYSEGVIITGIGNYGGVRYEDFTIDPRNINDVTVKGNSKVYNAGGYSTTDISGAIKLYFNSETPLVVDDVYDITVAEGPTETEGKYITPGTYPNVITLTAIEGAGKNFVGSRTVDFIIEDVVNIADCDIITSALVYNGTEQTPTKGTNVFVKRGTTEINSAYYTISSPGGG